MNRQNGSATEVAAPQRSLSIAIGIATRGRPQILARTLEALAQQTRQPDTILVASPRPADIGNAPERFPHIQFLHTAEGLTLQRNTILEAAQDADVLVFLDDDFYMGNRYLSVVEEIFSSRSDVSVLTGRVIADGINGPGLTPDDAEAILHAAQPAVGNPLRTVFNAYGCNMCLRMEPIRTHQLRFDENLPLYGWYEDVDFSRQMARYGAVLEASAAIGVHLGHKGGRTSGVRLGYSQVANPIYLSRKGTFPWLHALSSITGRVGKNLVRSARPEPWVDRHGRLRGNLQGFFDLLRGQLNPTKALHL